MSATPSKMSKDDERLMRAIRERDAALADKAALLAALKAAIEPLEVYHAYGWADRKGVRVQAHAAIAQAMTIASPAPVPLKSRPYCTFCGGDFGKHDLKCVKAIGGKP